MLETILYWTLIWFASGVISQIILLLIAGIARRRFPFSLSDGEDIFKSGLYGFLSAISAIIMIARGIADPSIFLYDESDGNILVLEGLTDEETELVLNYTKSLLEKRKDDE